MGGYTLYPHQRELVDKARDSMKQGNKHILIQSPAGSGKSIVIAQIIKDATEKGNHVLFFVHRQELVDQIRDDLKFNGVNSEYVTLMTVGKVANRLGKLPEPQLIVTDESHHARAKTYRKIYDYYEDAFRVGFTATPWRLSGEGFDDIYDDLILGKQVQWLIDHDYLADYKLYSINLIDAKKLKKNYHADYTKSSIDQALGKQIFGDVVTHFKKLASDHRAILYAHSIEASQAFAREFNKQGISASHADGKTPKAERTEIMQDFKSGQIQVLCNVDLISEGFNVPDCSCVIMARPTASLVLYIQQSMRCMRYQEGKEAIIIDHVGNYVRHGTPRMNREWTLEARPNKKKGTSEEFLFVKECSNCWAVIHSRCQRCPLCGFAFDEEKQELMQTDDELVLVDDGFQTDYKVINLFRKYQDKEAGELESVEDYWLYAKSRNYKEGWVKFNHPELKQMSWPAFQGVLKPIKEKYKELT